jgi:acetyltransferase-like isoleucine patch superfamily enzyme
MRLFFFFWVLRFFLYKNTFNIKGGGLSYLGRPLFFKNLKSKIVIDGSLGLFPHWRLEFHGAGKLEINGNVRIGQNFHCIIGKDLILHDGVTIAPDVYISTYETIFDKQNKRFIDREVNQKPIVINKNAFIGKGAMIFPGVEIGEGAIVAANAIIKKNVLKGMIATC